jgi:ribosomal protein S18 acetylase RimI-like enzyme
VTLRPAVAADEPFLRELFVDARRAELLAAGLGEREAGLLLDLQRRARDAHYLQAFPDAEYSVIEAEDAPVGRLVVDRRAGEMRVVDIALLSSCRGQGRGSRLLSALQAEAASEGRRVLLRVARGNAARRFYERLGFREVSGDDLDVELVWEAPGRLVTPADIREHRGTAA